MPPKWKTVYGEPFDEGKWKKAKERAEEEGHAEDWPYVVGIYKRMAKTGEYKTRFSAERKKKKQTVAAWKEKHPKWAASARRVATAKSMGHERLRLVVSHGELQEFRCGECEALLFKGLHLEMAVVETKCRRCGKILLVYS